MRYEDLFSYLHEVAEGKKMTKKQSPKRRNLKIWADHRTSDVLNFGRGYFPAIIILQRELWPLESCTASHMTDSVSEAIIFPIGSDTDGKNGCLRGTIGHWRIYKTGPWLK